MKRVLTFLVISLLNLSNACAESPGTSGCIVLKYPVGARAIGMGNAFTAVASDINSMYWNPAGLFLLEKRGFSTSCIDGVAEDVYYGHIFYAQPVDFRYIGSFGVGIATLQGGEAEIYDGRGGSLGKVTAIQDYVITLSGANDISPYVLSFINLPGEISLGFSLKGIRSTLPTLVTKTKKKYTSTSAFGFDLGVLYKLDSLLFESPVTYSLGLCLRNLGNKIKYGDSGDPLPFTMVFGGALKISLSQDSNITLAVDLNRPNDQNQRFNFGVEYWFRGICAIRGGYKVGYDKEGFAVGLGIPYANFQIDYAYSPIKDLGSDHRISFIMRF
ncbi:MAG: PorV/PorQ family protein [bacterium]|nr:PorV/PorQ family protein [bacterium]